MIDTDNAMRDYVETALVAQRKGTALPFAIVDQARDLVIGSTRYMDIAPQHRRLEIGATWLAPAVSTALWPSKPTATAAIRNGPRRWLRAFARP